jgi:hypothetical protein
VSDRKHREHTSPDTYQCGCHWTREPGFGDVLHECPIHDAATKALSARIDRLAAQGYGPQAIGSIIGGRHA